MAILVADVGGTNTRFAVVEDGVLNSIRSYENAKFASFYDILAEYWDHHGLCSLAGCCVAIAGPVTSTQAQLTNLNWQFDTADIASALPGPAGLPVRLVNDLAGLGYALAALQPEHLMDLKPLGTSRPTDPALVVGIGTGFNICLVKDTGVGGAPMVLAAELGHASLPHSVWSVLRDEIGADAAAKITDNEHLFSGRGLAGLYRTISGGSELGGPDITAAYDGDPANPATRTVDLAARLLGLFTRELVFQYLPFGGIHFAGGAARGILGSGEPREFLQAFDTAGPFSNLIGQVSVRLITEDSAALLGLARFAERNF